MKGGKYMNEQEKNTIEYKTEELRSNLKKILSSIADQTRESLKAMKAYPNKRVVEKVIHVRTQKIREKNMKKIMDWYRKKSYKS